MAQFVLFGEYMQQDPKFGEDKEPNEELKTYLLKCFSDSSSEYRYSTKVQERNQTSLLNQITVNEQPVLTYFNDDFFENNNLAIQMHDESFSGHRYSIISVIKENSNATVNIEENYYTYGGPLATSIHINFIILDKSISNVNYNIYRTITNNSYETDFGMFFIAGIVMSIAVVAIVSMLVVKHTREIENKPKAKKQVKK